MLFELLSAHTHTHTKIVLDCVKGESIFTLWTNVSSALKLSSKQCGYRTVNTEHSLCSLCSVDVCQFIWQILGTMNIKMRFRHLKLIRLLRGKRYTCSTDILPFGDLQAFSFIPHFSVAIRLCLAQSLVEAILICLWHEIKHSLFVHQIPSNPFESNKIFVNVFEAFRNENEINV